MKDKFDNTHVNPVLKGVALHEALQQLTNRQIVISPVGDSSSEFSTGFRIDDLNKALSDLIGEFGKLNGVVEINESFLNFARRVSKTKIQNYQEEFLKRVFLSGGRQHGKSTLSKALMTQGQAPQRLCDCLKCRMGKPNQCTTYSPKKRRGK